MKKCKMEYINHLFVSLILLPTIVTGVRFSISKEKVLLGSTGTLTMKCNFTESDIKTLHHIEIGEVSSTTNAEKDPIQWKTLAEMELGQTECPSLSPGINASAKNYVAEGSWDSTSPANTYLTLSMSIEKLVCDDARAYRCSLLYESSTKGTLFESPTKGTLISTDMNATFSAFVKPLVISLNVKKNGFKVQGMSPSDMTTAEVGDELELTCTANIGSYPQTMFRWHRTSETPPSDDFIGYQPPECTYDDGTAISDNQCGYTRVASIRYNVTTADANRDNNLAFECFVTVSGDPYGNSYTSENNPRFYIDVPKPDGGTTNSNTLAAETQTSTSSKIIASTSYQHFNITTGLENKNNPASEYDTTPRMINGATTPEVQYALVLIVCLLAWGTS